jgi:hypothetical protein
MDVLRDLAKELLRLVLWAVAGFVGVGAIMFISDLLM